MGETKEWNIKNQTYYFYDYIIDIRKFQSNLLKIDNYYIGYSTIKIFDKFSDHENIHSVNPLYLNFNLLQDILKKKMVRNI